LIYPPRLRTAATLPWETSIVVLGKVTCGCTKPYALPLLFVWTCGLRIVLMLILLTIKYGAWCRIVCIRCYFEMQPIWNSTWLTQHCGQCYWWMAEGTSCLCEWKGRTFWTRAVVNEHELGLAAQINWMLF